MSGILLLGLSTADSIVHRVLFASYSPLSCNQIAQSFFANSGNLCGNLFFALVFFSVCLF